MAVRGMQVEIGLGLSGSGTGTDFAAGGLN